MKDDGFITRVLWMSLATTIFVAWCLVGLGRSYEAASYCIGGAVSLMMLWTARVAVVKATTPGRLHGKWIAVTFAVAKYGVAAGVIWRFVLWRHAAILAFAAGVAVTQVVLTMKAMGQIVASHHGMKHAGPNPSGRRRQD